MNDKKLQIRVWQSFEIDDLKKHLLIIDDLYGSCANCKQLGLNFTKDKECPGCKTTFRYIASNSKKPEDIKKILNRIQDLKLNLIMIEKDDYTVATAKDAVKDLFKS